MDGLLGLLKGAGGLGTAIGALQTIGGLFKKAPEIEKAKVSQGTQQAVRTAQRNAGVTRDPSSVVAEAKIRQGTSNAQQSVARNASGATRALAGASILNKQAQDSIISLSERDARFRQNQRDRLQRAQVMLGREQQQVDQINRQIAGQQNVAKQQLIGAGFQSIINAQRDRQSAEILGNAFGEPDYSTDEIAGARFVAKAGLARALSAVGR